MLKSAWVRWVVVLGALLVMGYSAAAQVAITVSFAPPELPVYEQPLCPGEGYIWTPGYWAWDADEDDYYWVPGTWVLAPEVGYLWTPPYWGWSGGGYVFYPGYWGPRVGFYGGIVYGYGYYGHGYDGGRWDNGHFYYNRTVNNINVTEIHNVYNTRVEERNVNVARVSYNGGNGGVDARPTSEEERVSRERHIAATSAQTEHIETARGSQQFRASVNRGKPPVAATSKPTQFSGNNVVAARSGGNYAPPANRGHNAGAPPNATNSRKANPVHPKDLPPMERSEPPNTGNVKTDEKYQKQQAKLYEKQNQDRQKLQQKQEQEHAKYAKQQAAQAKQPQPMAKQQQQAARQEQQAAQKEQQQRMNEQRQQQMEQRHQQQTQQMEQKHTQERQQMQQRQTSPSHASPPPAQGHPQEPHHQ